MRASSPHGWPSGRATALELAARVDLQPAAAIGDPEFLTCPHCAGLKRGRESGVERCCECRGAHKLPVWRAIRAAAWSWARTGCRCEACEACRRMLPIERVA